MIVEKGLIEQAAFKSPTVNRDEVVGSLEGRWGRHTDETHHSQWLCWPLRSGTGVLLEFGPAFAVNFLQEDACAAWRVVHPEPSKHRQRVASCGSPFAQPGWEDVCVGQRAPLDVLATCKNVGLGNLLDCKTCRDTDSALKCARISTRNEKVVTFSFDLSYVDTAALTLPSQTPISIIPYAQSLWGPSESTSADEDGYMTMACWRKPPLYGMTSEIKMIDKPWTRVLVIGSGSCGEGSSWVHTPHSAQVTPPAASASAVAPVLAPAATHLSPEDKTYVRAFMARHTTACRPLPYDALGSKEMSFELTVGTDNGVKKFVVDGVDQNIATLCDSTIVLNQGSSLPILNKGTDPVILSGDFTPDPARVSVPFLAFHGVKLDMSEAQVRAAAGTPTEIMKSVDGCERGRHVAYLYEGSNHQFLNVQLCKGMGKQVEFMWTNFADVRTAEGVGVGSTQNDVMKAYPSARCEGDDDGKDHGTFTSRSCSLSNGEGEPYLDFYIAHDRVVCVRYGTEEP